MRAKLTREAITRIRAHPKRDVFVWDTSVMGLGVRVKPTGSKAYVVQYRMGSGRNSKSVRLTIDSFSSISLDDARKAARTIIGSVARGRDPRVERRTNATVQERRLERLIDAYDKDLNVGKLLPDIERTAFPFFVGDFRNISIEISAPLPGKSLLRWLRP